MNKEETPTLVKQSKKKKMSAAQRQDMLIENFIGLQRAMINLSVKFEDLSDNISRLLSVLEISAKDYLANKGKTTPEVDKDLLNKINSLLDQNKTIAQGLVMIEEKVRSKTEPQPQQQPQQNSQSQYKPRILETI